MILNKWMFLLGLFLLCFGTLVASELVVSNSENTTSLYVAMFSYIFGVIILFVTIDDKMHRVQKTAHDNESA